MKIVDLFCGCGGFSLGAHLAGFESILAVDIDPILSSAYAINYPNAKLLNADLSKINLASKLKGQDIMGVIGGPPCQGFSLIGKRQKDDPRNKLISHFFRHVLAINPAFFIMENVPGILMGNANKTLKNALKKLKGRYEIVGPIQVDAADFGAATRRARILVMGFDPKRIKPITLEDIEKIKKPSRVTVIDAISDLPSPVDVRLNKKDFDWIKYKPSKNTYVRKAISLPPPGIGSIEAVKHHRNREISGLLPTIHSPTLKKRYGKLKQGETDPISRSTKLQWDQLCKTLRAGTGSDKGSYQAVRPIHPEEPRVITVREAARLQGFPDWFVFHPTKWHSFRMIGNSVSPYLSEAIMKLIAERIFLSQNRYASDRLKYA